MGLLKEALPSVLADLVDQLLKAGGNSSSPTDLQQAQAVLQQQNQMLPMISNLLKMEQSAANSAIANIK